MTEERSTSHSPGRRSFPAGRILTRIWAVAALAMAMGAMSGCDDTGIGAGELADRSYVATASGIDGIDVAAGTVFAFTFSGDAVAASAGCNIIRADVDTVGDVLRAEDVVRSDLTCSDDLGPREAWLEAFIADAPVIDARDGSLTLTGATGAVTATEVDAEPHDS